MFDGQERDDVVASHSMFCKRYLTDYEPYCKRWVQLSVNEANSIKGVDINFGYLYHDIVSNEDRIEFHVNYWNRIQGTSSSKINQKSTHSSMKRSHQPVFVSPHRQDL
jgi:hypothetical protein